MGKIKPRKEIQEFAIEMERKFRMQHGMIVDFNCIFVCLFRCLQEETRELEDAINDYEYDAIISEAADVANFAMIISCNASEFKKARG